MLITGPSKSSSSLSPSAFAGNEIFGVRDALLCDGWFEIGVGGWKRTGECERADENGDGDCFGGEGGGWDGGGCSCCSCLIVVFHGFVGDGGWATRCLVGEVEIVDCQGFFGDGGCCNCDCDCDWN